MQYRLIMATLALSVYAAPAPMITGAPSLSRRQDGGGAAGGSSVLKEPMTIAAGESFDGGNAIFDRGVSCTGQEEGGDSDAVFILEKGATLSNVRIGPNQIEGVHCNGGCTLNNVVWDAVCEDAFSIKKQEDGETTTINGGGAKGAEDKVIQHNGGGTVIIKDFEVSDFGKLYRSCGNCKSMPARHVEISGGSATSGKMLVGINPNMGDTAKISGIKITDVSKECITFEGVTDGSEPKEVGTCDGAGGAESGSGSGSGDSTEAPATPTAPADSSESPVESQVADPVQTSVDGGSDSDNQSGDNENNDDDNNDDDKKDDDKKDEDEENKDEENEEQDSGDNNNQEQPSGDQTQGGFNGQQPPQPQFGAPPQFGGSSGFGGF